jgi:DivIVA domain-containing protein
MPLTPEDIENRTFEVRKRGYDKTQVDRFLGEIANAYRMVVEGGAEAAHPRQESVPTTPSDGGRRPLLGDASSAASPEPEALPRQVVDAPLLDPTLTPEPHPATIPQVREPLARMGNEVAAVLEAAQQQADRVRQDAEARAAKLRNETEQWSKQVTTDAERYAAARRQEVDADRQEAARQLTQARERTAAAEWAQEEADRRLEGVDHRVQAELDQAAREADRILEGAERAARARVEGILADADRRLEEAAVALGSSAAPTGGRGDRRDHGDLTSQAERRRPPTSPLRGGRRRTDPPVIDLVRDQDPIIDLVEGAPRTGRAAGEAPLYPVDNGTDLPRPTVVPEPSERPSPADPLTTLLADAVGEATEGQRSDDESSQRS